MAEKFLARPKETHRFLQEFGAITKGKEVLDETTCIPPYLY